MINIMPLKKQFHFIILLLSTALSAQNALNFDGVDDYIQTDYKGIEGDGARTVEAWIKVEPSDTWRFIVDMGTSGIGQRFSFKINNNARFIRIEVGGGGIYGKTTITDNKWHHVAATFDPELSENQFKLYVDGNLDGEGDLDIEVNTVTNKPVRIGYSNYNLGPFEGVLDEVRIWSVARTAEDIKTNMNTEICDAPNLELYYRFNQGSANGKNKHIKNALELTGNAQNSELIGFNLAGSTSNWVAGSPITPTPIDNTISIKGTTLSANLNEAKYQWVDCSNHNNEIKGATLQTYTPTTIGCYAVKVTDADGCLKFSKCIVVPSLNNKANTFKDRVRFSKNYSEKTIDFDLGASFQEIESKLLGMDGHTISESKFKDIDKFEMSIDQLPGLYFIQISTNTGDSGIFKIITQ